MKDTMADRDACCELIYRFYRHLDKREPEALDACMARDGTYLRPSGKVLPAGAELIADLKRSPPTMTLVHLLTNLFVDVQGEEARVRGYMTVFNHEGPAPHAFPLPLRSPMSIRDVDILLHKREGAWRISRLQNVLMFRTTA